MALILQVWKCNKLKVTCVSTAHVFLKSVSENDMHLHNNTELNNMMDVIDSFTTRLVQNTSDKWENMYLKKKMEYNTLINNLLEVDYSSFNIRNYDDERINALLNQYLISSDEKNIIIVANECLRNKCCPSPTNLQRLLSFFSQNGDKEYIIQFRNLIQEIKPDLYKINAEFSHYIAEAAWVKGNLQEAIKLFNEVYKNHVYLRRKVQFMIKYMAISVISNQSEASLVMLINFGENLALQYDDYYLLAYIWQICFLSDWYSDQCKATEILDRHKKLSDYIENRIQFVVHSALKCHKPDVVHRLLELLIKYEMKSHYLFILQSLFKYRYLQNDLRGCSEIIQWALNVNISLPEIQQEQFLILLLNQDKLSKKPIPTSKFKFKF